MTAIHFQRGFPVAPSLVGATPGQTGLPMPVSKERTIRQCTDDEKSVSQATSLQTGIAGPSRQRPSYYFSTSVRNDGPSHLVCILPNATLSHVQG